MFSITRNIYCFVGVSLIALSIQFGSALPSSAQEVTILPQDSSIWATAENTYIPAIREPCYTLAVRRAAIVLVQQLDKTKALISEVEDILSPTEGSDIKLANDRANRLKGELTHLEYTRDTIEQWIVNLSRIPPCVKYDRSVLLVDPPSALQLYTRPILSLYPPTEPMGPIVLRGAHSDHPHTVDRSTLPLEKTDDRLPGYHPTTSTDVPAVPLNSADVPKTVDPVNSTSKTVAPSSAPKGSDARPNKPVNSVTEPHPTSGMHQTKVAPLHLPAMTKSTPTHDLPHLSNRPMSSLTHTSLMPSRVNALSRVSQPMSVNSMRMPSLAPSHMPTATPFFPHLARFGRF